MPKRDNTRFLKLIILVLATAILWIFLPTIGMLFAVAVIAILIYDWIKR